MRVRRAVAGLLAAAVAGMGVMLSMAAPASANPEVNYIGPGPSFANTPGGVRCVQGATGAQMDGEYGQETYNAIRAYQAAHGLQVDGIVGPQTGDAIIMGLPSYLQFDCAQVVPTTFKLMDDNGNLAGGGTAYNTDANGDIGAAISMGKPMSTCLVKGIISNFTGPGRIIKVLWKRRLPTPTEWRAAPNPWTFTGGLIYCYVFSNP